MQADLLSESWRAFDSFELRLLLDQHVGGPGQYDNRADNPNKFYLPLARESCFIALTFRDSKIIAIESGPAFDATRWETISRDITMSILDGAQKVGREYSFCGYRVEGSWRGERSGLQILPPPSNAPRADVEIADHPFILEFPVNESNFWPLTNHRRRRDHRRLTALLNVLLAGGTSLQPRQPSHFWACVSHNGAKPESKWVQEWFYADLGEIISNQLSPPAGQQIEKIEPESYYLNMGHDGRGLRVPADLDESICHYLQLAAANRARFDRAAFWMDMASRQWPISMSSSFASMVTAVESLTDRGTTHRLYCENCKSDCQHEAPGATERFRAFFETFAAGASLRKRRSQMYQLRSGILHGSQLMEFDQDRAFGWDPPGWNEQELHKELWSLTRLALRNWLRDPSASERSVVSVEDSHLLRSRDQAPLESGDVVAKQAVVVRRFGIRSAAFSRRALFGAAVIAALVFGFLLGRM
jgi:hypothetical protein